MSATARTATNDLLQLAERIAAQAQSGEDVEVFATRSRQTEVRAYNGEVESLNSAASAGVAIRVVKDHRLGFAYAASLDDEAIAECLADARDNARFAGADEFNTVASPNPGDPQPPPATTDIGKLADTPVERKVDLALELERAARTGHPAVRGIEYAGYDDSVDALAVATSTGISAAWEKAGCFAMVGVLAGTGDETQTGDWYDVADTPDELDPQAIAATAIERAVRMLGAKQPSSRRLTVLLEPQVTAHFLGVIGGTLSGESVLKGYSPFADRVGERIGNAAISLVEDPTDPDAFGASRYDDEGVPTRRLPLITQGVLNGFVHNAYTGKRSGHGSTGSARRAGLAGKVSAGCRAIALAPGTTARPDLIASIDNGLLVQSVKGLHSGVNPISGDFSTGAEGVLIKDGVLAEPVREITIASTLQRMLQDAAAVGNDVTRLPAAAQGVTLVVEDVTMSGR